MTIAGLIVAESLAPGAALDVPLAVRRIRRVQAGSAIEGVQPEIWTLIDFACNESLADELADQLAAALLPGPWYADWAIGDSIKYVVFHARVFKIARGDAAGMAAAMEHARGAGVPIAQLDWAL